MKIQVKRKLKNTGKSIQIFGTKTHMKTQPLKLNFSSAKCLTKRLKFRFLKYTSNALKQIPEKQNKKVIQYELINTT